MYHIIAKPNLRTSAVAEPASMSNSVPMALRSNSRTLEDLNILLNKLKRDRQAYDAVSYDQLRHILCRRIAALTREMRPKKVAGSSQRRAA